MLVLVIISKQDALLAQIKNIDAMCPSSNKNSFKNNDEPHESEFDNNPDDNDYKNDNANILARLELDYSLSKNILL